VTDFILSLFVFVTVVSVFIVFPIVQKIRNKELVSDKTPHIWFKGKPLVLNLIGVACIAMYSVMFYELNGRINDTVFLTIAALLLAIPTVTVYIVLIALYHVCLWVKGKAKGQPPV
jgi:chromate transport protein ChrA